MAAPIIDFVIKVLHRKNIRPFFKKKNSIQLVRQVHDLVGKFKKHKAVKKFFKKMNNKKQLLFSKKLRKIVDKNASFRAKVKNFEEKAYNTVGVLIGRKPTALDKKMNQFITDYTNYLFPWRKTMTTIKSSYIQKGRYDVHFKTLYLKMVRSPKHYEFYNVPREVWVKLFLMTSHAGTYFHTVWDIYSFFSYAMDKKYHNKTYERRLSEEPGERKYIQLPLIRKMPLHWRAYIKVGKKNWHNNSPLW